MLLLKKTPPFILSLQRWILFLSQIHFWIYLWIGRLNLKTIFCWGILYAIIYYIAPFWINLQKQKHQRTLEQCIPEYMDLLSLILQSGLNLEQSLDYLAQSSQAPLTPYLKRALKFTEWGQPLEESLQWLSHLLSIPDFTHLLHHLLRARKLGVPLGPILELQSQILRTRRRQRAEELSRTASVKITLPLVFFIFPALLIIYLGPGLIRLLSS